MSTKIQLRSEPVIAGTPVNEQPRGTNRDVPVIAISRFGPNTETSHSEIKVGGGGQAYSVQDGETILSVSYYSTLQQVQIIIKKSR